MYPGDPGVLASLLLNRVRLSPGEGMYLPAGNLHAYLHGTAIEIMANSDNVPWGGLTPKHIDVPELLRVLDFTPDTGGRPASDGAHPGCRTHLPHPGGGVPALSGGARRHGTTSVAIDFVRYGPQMLAVAGGAIEVRTATGSR